MYTINEEEYQILQRALADIERQRQAKFRAQKAYEEKHKRSVEAYTRIVNNPEFCGIADYSGYSYAYREMRLEEALKREQPCIKPFNGHVPFGLFAGLRYTTSPAMYTNVLQIETVAALEEYERMGLRFPESFVEEVRKHEEEEHKALIERMKGELLRRRAEILPKYQQLKEELHKIDYDLTRLQ